MPILIVAAWIALVLTIRAADTMHLGFPLCAFRVFTGWPCPTCGATRAMLAFGRLDLAGAFWFNPLVCITALGLGAGTMVWLVDNWIGGNWIKTARQRLAPVPWFPLVIGAILANWVYLLLYLPR